MFISTCLLLFIQISTFSPGGKKYYFRNFKLTINQEIVLIVSGTVQLAELIIDRLQVKNIYKNEPASVRLQVPTPKINIERGVRQSHNISPKLFTAVQITRAKKLTEKD